jgi:hypothetical protein
MAAWFPCQHPEQIRVAQHTAKVHQLRGNSTFVVSMMVLGLAAQLPHNFGWNALVWQCAMGALA